MPGFVEAPRGRLALCAECSPPAGGRWSVAGSRENRRLALGGHGAVVHGNQGWVVAGVTIRDGHQASMVLYPFEGRKSTFSAVFQEKAGHIDLTHFLINARTRRVS